MNFSLTPQILLSAIFLLYLIIMIAALLAVKKQKSGRVRDRDDIREEKKFKVRFFRNLTEGFQLESIESLEDILNIYEARAGLSDEDLNYRYGLSRYLREYLIALISRDEKIIPQSTTEAEILEWKKILDKIISENDIQKPFSDLPPLERNILNDITIFMERNDTEHISEKLKELSRLIKSRDGELNRIYKRNDGSMQIAVVSLIVSLIFGLIAIKNYI
ncbi:MAG: hypothetical protein JXQ82_08855 [Methanomicrobiaceae archaeon]|nr:hypothetical protein [Methanomicrobiaceae archaeon]